VNEDKIATAGNAGIHFSSISAGQHMTLGADDRPFYGLTRLRDNLILTTQDDLTLHLTDTNKRTFNKLARPALSPSLAAIAAGLNNDVYIASYHSTPELATGVVVTHLNSRQNVAQSPRHVSLTTNSSIRTQTRFHGIGSLIVERHDLDAGATS
jgi:hypothetical protein